MNKKNPEQISSGSFNYLLNLGRVTSEDFQSNRPQFKSAPSQIGLKMKVISAQKNKNKKRINK